MKITVKCSPESQGSCFMHCVPLLLTVKQHLHHGLTVYKVVTISSATNIYSSKIQHTLNTADINPKTAHETVKH